MSDPRGMMRGMLAAASEPRQCEVCGDPIRADNRYGICTNGSKLDCLEARRRKRPPRALKPRPEPSRCCNVCGRPINRNNQSGVCGRRDNLACVRERGRRKRNGFAADLDRPVIAVGEIFGSWTTLEACAVQKQYVPCRCACGNERPVRGEKLIRGLSHSCGCEATAAMVRARFSDPYVPAGTVFGRLTVLRDVSRGGAATTPCASASAASRKK